MLLTQMLGTTEHDLVIRRKSTVPEVRANGEGVVCSHFEYFSNAQIGEQHFDVVIRAIEQALGFDEVQAEHFKRIAEEY